MPDIEVSIELFCNRCGAVLAATATAAKYPQDARFDIDPCEKCLENEYDKGHDDGYAEAEKDGEP